MQDTEKTVYLSTNSEMPCRECGTKPEPWTIDAMINHYMSVHDYALLHVGQETTQGVSGLWQCTVAVVGKERTPRFSP
jgi:hypothetical protein